MGSESVEAKNKSRISEEDFNPSREDLNPNFRKLQTGQTKEADSKPYGQDLNLDSREYAQSLESNTYGWN